MLAAMLSFEASSKRRWPYGRLAGFGCLLFGLAAGAAAQGAPPDPSQPYLQPPPLSTEAAASDTAEAAAPPPSETSPSASPATSAPASPPSPSPPPAYSYTPPPPPPAQPPPRPLPEEEPERSSGFSMPPLAIGFEPLDMILEGRFAPQLEVGLWEFISIELVPLFFIDDSPLLWDVYGLNGRGEALYRTSNGIGPLVGASLGVGFWLGGTPFSGMVLRPFITNYGVEYTSKLDGAVLDTVTFTERRLGLLFGSMNRLGPLALSFGIGLSYELNPYERCQLDDTGPTYTARSHDCGGQLLIGTGSGDVDLFGPLHPIAIEGRLAIAIVVD